MRGRGEPHNIQPAQAEQSKFRKPKGFRRPVFYVFFSKVASTCMLKVCRIQNSMDSDLTCLLDPYWDGKNCFKTSPTTRVYIKMLAALPYFHYG